LIFKYRDDDQKPVEKPSTNTVAAPIVAESAVAAPASTPAPVITKPSAQPQAHAAVAADAHQETAADLTHKRGTSPWIFRLSMLALLGVLLGALFAYRTRPVLYNSPTARPVLEAGCKVFGCVLPARIDLNMLQMVKRNVYSHPNTPNALVINVSFRNDAEFDQQLPLLHMVLSNRVGRTVAKQDFSPVDYLPDWQEGAIIESNQQLDVTLEVTDPGQDAQSFEFYFREFKS